MNDRRLPAGARLAAIGAATVIALGVSIAGLFLSDRDVQSTSGYTAGLTLASATIVLLAGALAARRERIAQARVLIETLLRFSEQLPDVAARSQGGYVFERGEELLRRGSWYRELLDESGEYAAAAAVHAAMDEVASRLNFAGGWRAERE